MHKTHFFLKGSAREQRWLNRQADRGYQLTAVTGWTYHFQRAAAPRGVVSEYLPATTLEAMAADFKPVATVPVKGTAIVVSYANMPKTHRIVSDDTVARLAVYRQARNRALNWMNGWVAAIWLLMCLALFTSTKVAATPGWAALLWSVLIGGALLIVVGMVICVTAAVRCHRTIRHLVRITGDDEDVWKPTMHILFKHQPERPDIDQWQDMGRWQLAMHNQRGDYYFNLQTSLNAYEIKSILMKVINQRDFTVMSWVGNYH